MFSVVSWGLELEDWSMYIMFNGSLSNKMQPKKLIRLQNDGCSKVLMTMMFTFQNVSEQTPELLTISGYRTVI